MDEQTVNDTLAPSPAQPASFFEQKLLEQPLDLIVYWRSIHKHLWQILGLAGALTLLALAIVLMMTPIYRSTVTILIEQNKAQVVSIKDVYNGMSDSLEYYQTQAEILKSAAVAARVVKDMKLDTDPAFDPRQQPKSMRARLYESLGLSKPEPWTQENIMSAIQETIMSNMRVEPVRRSQLIEVSYDAPDPVVAAKIANAIANAYIVSDMDARFQMTKKASDWLNEQLVTLRSNLDKSQQVLQDYREKAHMVDTKGLAQMGAVRQIEDLTQSLVTARAQSAAAQNAYLQVSKAKEGDLASLPIVQQNVTVGRLVELRSEAERKVAELSKRYGNDHPKMTAAQSELAQTKENLQRQIKLVASSLERDYEAAKGNERVIASTMGKVKGSLYGVNRKEFQLQSLQRDVDANQGLYDMFMNRLKETAASRDNQTNVVARVIDPATPDDRPIKPNKPAILAITLFMGLFIGVLIALLLERLDSTLKSPDDVEAKLGLPVLASLPKLTREDAETPGAYFMAEPKSVFSEGIRTARTGVLLSAIDEEHKVLVITSTLPGEGKTTFAVNLAVAHAHTKKALLLDTDMRRPSVIKNMGLDAAKPGLSNLVSGAASLSECIQTIEGSTLHVIGAGDIPPNPLELILSRKFGEMLEILAKSYDVIIIDSPPVQLVSDAVVLSTHATGVIFVVKADETPYQIASRCIRTLASADANLVGIVFNQLDFNKADRYYGAYIGYAAKQYDGYYTKAT